jgi:hypothetical protein
VSEVHGDGRHRSLESVHQLFPEALALSNPVLSALLIAWAAREHERGAEVGMTFPLSFLVLPLTLHEPSRDSILQSPRLSFSAWARRNQRTLDSYARRAQVMAEPTRRGIRFGLNYRLLFLEDGVIHSAKRLPAVAAASDEARASVKALRRLENGSLKQTL